MSEKNDTKWKNRLLKTSLPLELLTAEKLEQRGFTISGEYPYPRPDENGVEKEFSIDTHAFDLLQEGDELIWGALHLLVESKYQHPGSKWVFSPVTRSSLIVTGTISILDSLTSRVLADGNPIFEFDDAFPFCTKGIALYAESDADQKNIKRGLSQLQFAIPNLLSDLYREQIHTFHDQELAIGFLCPLLVTTASLHTLKAGLDLEGFHRASNLEDVADEVDAVIVQQVRGVHLTRYCNRALQTLLRDLPELQGRLQTLARLQLARDKPPEKGDEDARQKSFWSRCQKFEGHFEFGPQRVLVVNFEALNGVVKRLREAVETAGANLIQLGKLGEDVEAPKPGQLQM